MTSATLHEVKPADEVIADDVICQSFIQSSCTLAYACLLIRRRRFDLATHVLHSLEAKQASRFKDMVFYLQAQIGIETGEYAMVKRRLLPRVHRHPNDLVALSLLECCIHREYAAEERTRPAQAAPAAAALPPPGPFGNAEAASAAVMASALAATELPAPESPRAVPAHPPEGRAATAPRPELVEIPFATLPFPAPAREAPKVHRAAAPESDMGPYQGIANDPNALAMGLWNAKGRTRTFCRAPDLETLMGALPRELPGSLRAACFALESGAIHKICFSFQHLTATTFHAGLEGMALITGPLNQSLLTIVRAENTFKKASAGGASAPGMPGAGAPA